MADLIKRDDALKAIIASSDLHRSSVTTQRMIRALPAVDPVVNAPEYLCTFPQCGCVAKGQWCPAPRPPAAIREAALREAADLVWSEDDDRPWESWGEYRNIATAQTVAKEIRDAILALIGETK